MDLHRRDHPDRVRRHRAGGVHAVLLPRGGIQHSRDFGVLEYGLSHDLADDSRGAQQSDGERRFLEPDRSLLDGQLLERERVQDRAKWRFWRAVESDCDFHGGFVFRYRYRAFDDLLLPDTRLQHVGRFGLLEHGFGDDAGGGELVEVVPGFRG